MSLTLHFHPLSSFCHKVLIALYENGTPFTPQIVNLMDEGERTAFRKLWPIGKFPVLRDDARGETVPESSVIIEYLDRHYPGRHALHSAGRRAAHARCGCATASSISTSICRCRRSWATGCGLPTGRIRMASRKRARRSRPRSDMIEQGMLQQPWAIGDAFTLADCAAAPSLFYADKVMPFGASHPNAAAYLERLKQRPSYARVLAEAEPYFRFFPQQ